MYCSMYVGYLMLDESEAIERKILIARRYIINALARARASAELIDAQQYSDLERIDEICQPGPAAQ